MLAVSVKGWLQQSEPGQDQDWEAGKTLCRLAWKIRSCDVKHTSKTPAFNIIAMWEYMTLLCTMLGVQFILFTLTCTLFIRFNKSIHIKLDWLQQKKLIKELLWAYLFCIENHNISRKKNKGATHIQNCSHKKEYLRKAWITWKSFWLIRPLFRVTSQGCKEEPCINIGSITTRCLDKTNVAKTNHKNDRAFFSGHSTSPVTYQHQLIQQCLGTKDSIDRHVESSDFHFVNALGCVILSVHVKQKEPK